MIAGRECRRAMARSPDCGPRPPSPVLYRGPGFGRGGSRADGVSKGGMGGAMDAKKSARANGFIGGRGVVRQALRDRAYGLPGGAHVCQRPQTVA